jgi:hypothetical protein
MYILDYDEFNIYTTSSDVESYIEGLIEEGISIKEEIYEKCILHFGHDLKNLVDEIFSPEDED